MDVLITVICGIIVLSVLVFIHEGGHFLAARAFGVRVTEFMIGLPGPSIGFTLGETKFGLTAVPLGGYAKVCGMDTGQLSPHLKPVLASVYKNGKVSLAEVAQTCLITKDDAEEALEQLAEWGSICEPKKHTETGFYTTPQYKPTISQRNKCKKKGLPEPGAICAGTPREIDDIDAFYQSELERQYRYLPFWKRSVILLAGVFVNLLFALLAFVIIYSVLGFNVTNNETGEITHMTVGPLRSISAGFNYIGMVVMAIVALFNPQTAAETVSNSTSIIGIAVMSVDYFAAGFQSALLFMAMISVSLGLMNLLPIPPLDGGRFIIEVFQRLTKVQVSVRVLNYLSLAGMTLFMCFFVVMLNQDVQRFVFGNW
jgi:regulator of sigma E protease